MLPGNFRMLSDVMERLDKYWFKAFITPLSACFKEGSIPEHAAAALCKQK